MSANFVPYQPLGAQATSYDVVQAQEAVRVTLDAIRDDLDDALDALGSNVKSSGGVLPEGYHHYLLSSTDDVTLPSTGSLTLTLKNISSGSVTVNAPDDFTIFADVAGYTSVVLAIGDAIKLVRNGFVWYIV